MKPNAEYTMTNEDGAYQFCFHCAYCKEGHTTGRIVADSVEAALSLAWQEAREYFNGCHKCGKWICEKHYNMEEMMCTDCAPLEADPANQRAACRAVQENTRRLSRNTSK
jgi:hypothetical protein